MSEIHVCPLSKVDQTARNSGASHMITLLSDSEAVKRPETIAKENHLHLTFNDIAVETDGFVLPGERDVRRLIEFVHSWDQHAPLMVHCWMGVSRSTAGAYIAAASLMPQADEFDLAQMLRTLSPSATPNAMMIELADHVLGREGRMNAAVHLIGRGADAYEGDVFMLPIMDTKAKGA